MLGLGNNLAGGTGVTSWSPSSLSSLLHWYRFDTGITQDATPDVTLWEDQKGNNDLTATGVSAVSPGYSGGAVVFNAPADIMTFDSPLELGKFSFYIRLKSDALEGDFLALEDGGGDFFKIHSTNAGVTVIRTKITSRQDYTINSAPSPTTKFNIGSERDGNGDIMMYIDGSAATLDTTNAASDGNVDISDTWDLATLGASAATCTYYEVVICNDALSAPDRALLNTYLNSI